MKSRITLLCAIAIVALAVAPWVQPEPLVAQGPLCPESRASQCTAASDSESLGTGTLVAVGAPRR